VTSIEIDLTDIFNQFKKLFKGSDNLSLANTRSRLRMVTLYQIASMNNNKGIVVGTGNKVEDFGIGFFTKYGDGGVDLSPIADLTKTQVRMLAEEVQVIEDICLAPPTDGLWADGRTDEDQLGATYPELEWAMEFNGNEDHLTARQMEVLSIYNKLNRINQHKMIPIPVCQIPKDLL
jgi:NAD+ synthase